MYRYGTDTRKSAREEKEGGAGAGANGMSRAFSGIAVRLLPVDEIALDDMTEELKGLVEPLCVDVAIPWNYPSQQCPVATATAGWISRKVGERVPGCAGVVKVCNSSWCRCCQSVFFFFFAAGVVTTPCQGQSEVMGSIRDLFVPGQCVLIEWLDSLRSRDGLWQAPIAAARRKRVEDARVGEQEGADSGQSNTALSTQVPEEEEEVMG